MKRHSGCRKRQMAWQLMAGTWKSTNSDFERFLCQVLGARIFWEMVCFKVRIKIIAVFSSLHTFEMPNKRLPGKSFGTHGQTRPLLPGASFLNAPLPDPKNKSSSGRLEKLASKTASTPSPQKNNVPYIRSWPAWSSWNSICFHMVSSDNWGPKLEAPLPWPWSRPKRGFPMYINIYIYFFFKKQRWRAFAASIVAFAIWHRDTLIAMLMTVVFIAQVVVQWGWCFTSGVAIITRWAIESINQPLNQLGVLHYCIMLFVLSFGWFNGCLIDGPVVGSNSQPLTLTQWLRCTF